MIAAFIFGLLIVLMLTGMPVSIALGLTVDRKSTRLNSSH